MENQSLDSLNAKIEEIMKKIVSLENKVEALEKNNNNFLDASSIKAIEETNIFDIYKSEESLTKYLQLWTNSSAPKGEPQGNINMYESEMILPHLKFNPEKDKDSIEKLIEIGIHLNKKYFKGQKTAKYVAAFELDPAAAKYLEAEIVKGKHTISYYLSSDMNSRHTYEKGEELEKNKKNKKGYKFSNVIGIRLNGKTYRVHEC